MRPAVGGEYQCSQGGRLSQSVGRALVKLVGSEQPSPSASRFRDQESARWFCPRCGLPTAREGAELGCPICGLSLSPILRELTELNPHLPQSAPPEDIRVALELHDSRLEVVEQSAVTLTMYVHRWIFRRRTWTGTGWRQAFRFELPGPRPAGLPFPVDLAGGRLVVADAVHRELIPYPLRERGPARLVLECTPGGTLDLQGELAAVQAIGDARFVEELPAEFAPGGAAG